MIGGLELLDGEDQAPGLRLRDFLATALSFALGTDCLIGWSREDELLAFFPNGGTRFAIKRRIEDAFAYVRVSMADMKEIDRLRLVAGVSDGRIGDADYQVMVLQAGYLCELWKIPPWTRWYFPMRMRTGPGRTSKRMCRRYRWNPRLPSGRLRERSRTRR